MNNKELDFQENIIRSSSEAASEVRFIQDRKQLALAKLKDLDFPKKKDEDWKYYDFSDILDFETSEQQNLSKAELVKLVDQYVFRETANNLLVTVDGFYSEELSNFEFNRDEIKILNFNNSEEIQADTEIKSLVEKLFAQNLENEDRYFKTINTILMQSGFMLYIKPGFESEVPLQILHISTQNSFNQIRSLICAGANSKLKLIVSDIGLEGSQYFTNTVIESFLEPGAKIKLDRIQNESKLSTKLYNFTARLERDSNFEFNSYSFGAQSNREDINVDICGEGAHASINGLYVLGQKRKSHHKVTINHLSPHATSSQLFKGILQDQSRAEFNGLITVARDAQKTDAEQLNKNLLLSDQAHIDSRPQLDILADDVKCAHGSTTGNLDPEEIFYLQSRGLNLQDAQAVLTYSFIQELIEKIEIKSAQNYTSNIAFSTLGKAQGQNALENLAENSKFKKSRYQ